MNAAKNPSRPLFAPGTPCWRTSRYPLTFLSPVHANVTYSGTARLTRLWKSCAISCTRLIRMTGDCGRKFHIGALAAPGAAVPLEDALLLLEPEHRSEARSRKRVRQHRGRCRSTNSGLWTNAAGRCRTFIQRSARHRRNSMSAAGTCSSARRRSSRRSGTILVDDEAPVAELLRHRRARVRRRMLDVRPVDVPPRELQVGLDRLARVVRIADDQAADDEQAVAMQVRRWPRWWRCRPCGRARGARSSRAP